MKRRICFAWLSALLGVDQTCMRCLSTVHWMYPQLCPCPLVSSTSKPAASASSSASRTCFFECDHLVMARRHKHSVGNFQHHVKGEADKADAGLEPGSVLHARRSTLAVPPGRQPGGSAPPCGGRPGPPLALIPQAASMTTGSSRLEPSPTPATTGRRRRHLRERWDATPRDRKSVV